MTMTGMPSDREAESRYEELRRSVVEAGSGPSPGLAVLLRRGLVSWMTSISHVPTPPKNRGEPSLFPVDTKPQIVRILAGMIIGPLSRERA